MIFLETKQAQPKNIYLTHGLTDFLDPEGVIKNQLVNFSQRMEPKENIVCHLKIYEKEGHVLFRVYIMP